MAVYTFSSFFLVWTIQIRNLAIIEPKECCINFWILNRNFQKSFEGKGITVYGEHIVMLELGLGLCFLSWV